MKAGDDQAAAEIDRTVDHTLGTIYAMGESADGERKKTASKRTVLEGVEERAVNVIQFVKCQRRSCEDGAQFQILVTLVLFHRAPYVEDKYFHLEHIKSRFRYLTHLNLSSRSVSGVVQYPNAMKCPGST